MTPTVDIRTVDAITLLSNLQSELELKNSIIRKLLEYVKNMGGNPMADTRVTYSVDDPFCRDARYIKRIVIPPFEAVWQSHYSDSMCSNKILSQIIDSIKNEKQYENYLRLDKSREGVKKWYENEPKQYEMGWWNL